MQKIKYYYSQTWFRTPAYVFSNDYSVPNRNETVNLEDSERRQLLTVGCYGKSQRSSRITICSVFDTEMKQLFIGYTICDPRDTFKKSIGRKIAYEKAMKNPYKTIDIKDEDKISKVANAAVADIMSYFYNHVLHF